MYIVPPNGNFPSPLENTDDFSMEIDDFSMEVDNNLDELENLSTSVENLINIFKRELSESSQEITSLKLYIVDQTNENKDTITAKETDAKNNPQQTAKALQESRLFVEYEEANGDRHIAVSPELTKKMKDSEFLHLHDQDGNLQHIHETKSLNIRNFTAKEVKLFTHLIMASFAAQQARERLETLKKNQEEHEKKMKENQRQKNEEDLLRRTLNNKDHHKEVVKANGYKPEANIGEKRQTQLIKENQRLIFQKLLETLGEDRIKKKLERKLDSIKQELIIYINLLRQKKAYQTNSINQEFIVKSQLIKNLQNLPSQET